MTASRSWLRPTLALAVALLAAAAPAAARELHWRALGVEATLESDGTLAIAERQEMVFTGDWNGGERRFRLFPGQRLTVDRIVRIDAVTGAARELEQGDLDVVDRWDWAGSGVVRWRARRPEDPPFDATTIVYRLDYRLTGALLADGGRAYRLDHDWAFPDREGTIERVEVRLRLGEGWRAVSDFAGGWTTENLPPGQGFVVPLALEFDGAGQPAARVPPVPLPPAARWGAVAIFLGGVAYFLFCLVWRERALGRLGAAAAAPIDAAWLEQNLFTMAPEVVGAAWDRSVGSAEVAAVLARLTGEGKLAAEVKSSGRWIFRTDNLHLRLLGDRGSLSDYERALIDALFGVSDTTDTQSVRQRYRSSGFDPATKIRAGLEARLKRSRGFEAGSPKPDWRPTGLLLAGGVLLLGASFAFGGGTRGLAFAPLVLALLPWLPLGLVPALVGQGKVRVPAGALTVLLAGMGVLAAGVWAVGVWPGASLLHLGGALLVALGLARSAFNLVTTRESPESLARRRELARARDFFERELARREPRLEDRWYPYLLAFGLAPQVDRWFRRFGEAATGSGFGSTTTGSGGGSFSGGGSGWSGGGGAFGGAGASASFAAAATAMGSGVSAPGSSSGSGGGGGSSGGGGGGGW